MCGERDKKDLGNGSLKKTLENNEMIYKENKRNFVNEDKRESKFSLFPK